MSGLEQYEEITRLRAEVAELRSQRDRARLALDVALAAGAECEGHIAELRAEIAAKDARIAELESVMATRDLAQSAAVALYKEKVAAKDARIEQLESLLGGAMGWVVDLRAMLGAALRNSDEIRVRGLIDAMEEVLR